jgi:hypothetical protein
MKVLLLFALLSVAILSTGSPTSATSTAAVKEKAVFKFDGNVTLMSFSTSTGARRCGTLCVLVADVTTAVIARTVERRIVMECVSGLGLSGLSNLSVSDRRELDLLCGEAIRVLLRRTSTWHARVEKSRLGRLSETWRPVRIARAESQPAVALDGG